MCGQSESEAHESQCFFVLMLIHQSKSSKEWARYSSLEGLWSVPRQTCFNNPNVIMRCLDLSPGSLLSLPGDRWILMIAGGFSGHGHQGNIKNRSVDYGSSNTETELFLTGAYLKLADFLHWKRSNHWSKRSPVSHKFNLGWSQVRECSLLFWESQIPIIWLVWFLGSYSLFARSETAVNKRAVFLWWWSIFPVESYLS